MIPRKIARLITVWAARAFCPLVLLAEAADSPGKERLLVSAFPAWLFVGERGLRRRAPAFYPRSPK
jgi:hypothetical protein